MARAKRPESELRGHVVLCGLEGLSVRTLEELDRLGERVVVIAQGGEPRHRSIASRLALRIIDGDPADPEVLRAAGIPGARAIVLTVQADVGNIHGALAAVALDPGIQVVIRVFHEELGRQVETLIPNAVAISASEIAAPGFVSAIVDAADERRIDMMGRDLALRRVHPSDPNVVVVLADESRSPVSLFPSTGEQLLCIVDASGDAAAAVSARPRARLPLAVRPPRASVLRRVDRRFWALALVIVALVGLSAAVFGAVTGISPADAVYQAIKGVLGGAGDAVLGTPELRFFAVALAVLGAVLLAAFYGLIADVILSARVSNLLGPHATDARDHVIVIGLGSIGFRIASALVDRGFSVVAADSRADGRFVEAARARGIALVVTDAHSPDTLRQLRIDRARALVAATDDDAANLASALQARGMRPDLRIVIRLFDPDLAMRLEHAFGGYESRSVSALAAPTFASAAVGRQVVATIPIGVGRVLVVARVPIEPGSAADGSTIGVEESRASSIERGGCRVIAVVEGEQVRWKPAPDDPVRAGQELTIVATRRGMAITVQRGAAATARREAGASPASRVAIRLPFLGTIDLAPLETAARRLVERVRHLA